MLSRCVSVRPAGHITLLTCSTSVSCSLLVRADAENQYDYSPSLAAGVIFVLLFSLLSILHLGILIKSRIWWTSVRPPLLRAFAPPP